MSLLRLALPALAVAGTAYAACSASATQTIESGGDASAVASCSTFSGSIAVATGLGTDLDLGDLEKITGDFAIDSNSEIQRISAAKLSSIEGSLSLNDVSQLASLSFPELTEVDTMSLKGLANLRGLEFTKTVQKCSKLDIQNTQLQDLKGLNFTECDEINIANNDAIAEISMSLTNITSLIVSFNNEDVNVTFPQLEGAQNITCRACGSLDISALSELRSGLMVFDSKLESVEAGNLTKIDGALIIDRNENLKNVSFPKLTDVSKDLQIANNTQLGKINGFPALENVGAALDLSGNFTESSTPKLNFVKGVFNLQSTADIGTTCDFYDDLKDKKKVPKTDYVCKGKLKEAGQAGSTPTGGDSSKPSGAASPLNVQNTYLGLAGLAAVLLV